MVMKSLITKTALAYDDITLVPNFSEIESRSKIDLTTKLTTNYKLVVPLIASPMDTVCGGEMAVAMANLGGVGCIHRFMTIEEQVSEVEFFNAYPIDAQLWGSDKVPIMAAIGANGDYLERAQGLTNAGVNVILIDVAHGYHKFVRDAINSLKKTLSSSVDVIAGNIATGNAAEALQSWGADALRVGIGGGCFTPNMLVGTINGMKPIVDVVIGDVVFTHTGEPKEVVHKFEYDRDEKLMVINGIECTKNHEFYVVHTRYADQVTDENIHEYAQWIPAELITNDYWLIKI